MLDMSVPGQNPNTCLGAVCPIPPSADIRLRQQSVGKVAPLCLAAGKLDRVVQQRSIAAPHQALARRHETARFVFARIAFPIGLGAMKAKESFGDGPVALAALARVEGTQCQNMQFPELSWHRPKGAARRSAVKSAPQSPRRMRAQFEQGVERQSQGIGCGGVRWLLNQPELMDGPAHVPHAMPAIIGTPQIEAGKMCQVDRRCRGRTRGRRCGQQHGFGLQARNPEYRLSISRLQGVAWEIATPSAVRRLQGLLRPETCGGLLGRNRDDSHHRDEDTPTRIRRRE